MLKSRDTGSRQWLSIGRNVVLGYGMVWLLVIVLIICEVLYHGFLSGGNIKVLLDEGSTLGIVAVGETMVILLGNFDLSVGSTVALAAVMYAKWGTHHSLLLIGVAVVLIGGLIGLVNGLLVTFAKINSFIATLATGSAIGGFAYIFTNSQPVSASRPGFASLATSTWLGLRVDIWVMIGIFVLAQAILSQTRLGRAVYAIGGNPEASRLSGIRVRSIVISSFVMAGAFAGLGALIMVSRLQIAQGTFSGSISLDAIAIVVIGGARLGGGEGTIWGTAIGFLIITAVNGLLDAKAVNASWSDVVIGCILASAVGVEYLSRSARSRAEDKNRPMDDPTDEVVPEATSMRDGVPNEEARPVSDSGRADEMSRDAFRTGHMQGG